jgi:tricarballylate dehydrogenase
VFDVLVVGGGNAGLCAALEARRRGARVLLIEAAPRHLRGGNSRHTRDIRYTHKDADGFATGPYPEAEFWDDLVRVTGGRTNESLARLMIQGSEDVPAWMHAHGARWQPPLRGTLHLARTNGFFLGGGKAVVNAYYAAAEALGVEVAYETEARGVELDAGGFRAATLARAGQAWTLAAGALVVASGGFEANLDWLKRYWGDAADNLVVRGTPYNRGAMLAALLDAGAQSAGDPREFHAVAVDARAPKFDGGIVTRLDSVPFGIVVNRQAARFYDEGEDFWPKRYAIWGGLIARQPDQIAYSIVDAQASDAYLPSVYPPVVADTVPELAAVLGLDGAALADTVQRFNASVRPGRFDPAALDDCHTEGLVPPKSHWARPIERSPFHGYPLRPGITFTYLGLAVNTCAQVLRQDGQPYANVFAAGELMAGNILGRGYLGGVGLTIGTVFGRIAGREAARAAGC